MKSEQKDLNDCIIAVDIGGTLTKVALTCNKNKVSQVFSSISQDKVQSLEIKAQNLGNVDLLQIYFMSFFRTDNFFTFLKENVLKIFKKLKIVATGGGALKFKPKFEQLQQKCLQKNKQFEFKVQMNEFETIISAVQLLIDTNVKVKLSKKQQIADKLLIEGKRNKQTTQYEKLSVKLEIPLILVNLGSGISFLKLQYNQNKSLQFTRIGGSSLGGGFLLGLQKLVNQNFSFQKFTANHLTQNQSQIMKICIKNVSQLINLYSDIHNVNTILITGGMAKADIIKNEFSEQLSTKNVFFTEIDGLLSVIGTIFSEWKKNKNH